MVELSSTDASSVSTELQRVSANGQLNELGAKTMSSSNEALQTHFQYCPLERDAIRLFKILPREDDGIIRCQIEYFHLDSDKHHVGEQSNTYKYFCLSYAWGLKIPTHEIEIDGKKFNVCTNLWHFLKRLESPVWPSHYLWADAISINQLDNVEKNAQVAMMNETFRRADGVLAWVGEEADDSALLMNLAKFHRDQPLEMALSLPYASAQKFRVWKALKAFLERSYWKRTWIIQEIILAAGPIWIHCGIDVTEYRAIYGLFEIFKLQFELKDLLAFRCKCKKRQKLCKHQVLLQCAKETCQNEIPTLRSYHQQQDPSHRIFDISLTNLYASDGVPRERLIDLLYRYRDTECEDPRDKIFALLHIQMDIPRYRIPYILDYRKERSALFFEMLSIHTRADEFLEWKDEELLFFFRKRSENLVHCGRLLMHALRISPFHLRQWLCATATARERFSLNSFLRPKVLIEHVCGYAGSARVTSAQPTCWDGLGPVSVFDVVDAYYAERPRMRGIAVEVQIGDSIFRAEDSDIGIIVRAFGDYSAPVSWAVIGEGTDWRPDKWMFQRLQMLLNEPVPSRKDFTGINETREIETVMEIIRNQMSESDISRDELARFEFERRDTSSRTPWRYMVSIDLPVAVSIIEGYFLTKRDIERSKEEDDDNASIHSLFAKFNKTVPLQYTSIRMKRPWRRIRLRSERRARVYVKYSQRRQAHRFELLWRCCICPGINQSHRRQRLHEAFQWQHFLEALVDDESNSSQYPGKENLDEVEDITSTAGVLTPRSRE